MFERMEIDEFIYKGVLEPSYKKPTREDFTSAVHRRQKIGESASSWTSSHKGEISSKHSKQHVDSPTEK